MSKKFIFSNWIINCDNYFFQILIPSQPIDSRVDENDEVLEPATSIDGQNKETIEEVKSLNEVITSTKEFHLKIIL